MTFQGLMLLIEVLSQTPGRTGGDTQAESWRMSALECRRGGLERPPWAQRRRLRQCLPTSSSGTERLPT